MNFAHCKGTGCPLKENCKRNEHFRNSGIEFYKGNSSFIPEMFNIDKGKPECGMFIGDEGSLLLMQLKNIFNYEK